MNLETRLRSDLWIAVESSYRGRSYSNAILDAVRFLSDAIRNRTGLESDGATLVGEAFGGSTPKLKVNKLQTESERTVQRGVEQLLRGLYQAIRNPRSHGTITDTPEEADAIILFVDFLLRLVGTAKTEFEIQTYLERVFDLDFVEKDAYAKILVDEIPTRQRLNVAVEVYRKKETGQPHKLAYFFRALMTELSPEERIEFLLIVSDELQVTSSDEAILSVLQIIGRDYWSQLADVARMRIENKLIGSIAKGTWGRGRSLGGFGTWIVRIADQMLLKDDLLRTLAVKLESSWEEQDYVFRFFFSKLHALCPEPTHRLKGAIHKGLKAGDKRFHAALMSFRVFDEQEDWFDADDRWVKEFKDALFQFVEVDPAFQGITDDDVPF